MNPLIGVNGAQTICQSARREGGVVLANFVIYHFQTFFNFSNCNNGMSDQKTRNLAYCMIFQAVKIGKFDVLQVAVR